MSGNGSSFVPKALDGVSSGTFLCPDDSLEILFKRRNTARNVEVFLLEERDKLSDYMPELLTYILLEIETEN